MAVWSKALPLTASCLSPLPGCSNPGPGHVRMLLVTLGKAVVLPCTVPSFPTS